MSGKAQFTAAEFIAAIPGSGGIIATIAQRIGCDWHTAKKYINNYPTIKQAYDDECESILDLSESVVFGNIHLAAKEQKMGRIADTGDAKWLLSRKGKQRGYVDKIENEQSGQVEIIVTYANSDLDTPKAA